MGRDLIYAYFVRRTKLSPTQMGWGMAGVAKLWKIWIEAKLCIWQRCEAFIMTSLKYISILDLLVL